MPRVEYIFTARWSAIEPHLPRQRDVARRRGGRRQGPARARPKRFKGTAHLPVCMFRRPPAMLAREPNVVVCAIVIGSRSDIMYCANFR